jgi:hypothetical protein
MKISLPHYRGILMEIIIACDNIINEVAYCKLQEVRACMDWTCHTFITCDKVTLIWTSEDNVGGIENTEDCMNKSDYSHVVIRFISFRYFQIFTHSYTFAHD